MKLTEKIKRVVLLIGALSSMLTAEGQFLFTRQGSVNNYFISALEDANASEIFITDNSHTLLQSANQYRSNCYLFRIDNSGNLLDSLALDTNFIPGSAPLKAGGSYYLPGIRYRYYGSALTSFPVIYNYDLNFNFIKRVAFDSVVNNFAATSKLLLIKSKLYMGCFDPAAGSLKFYKLDLSLARLDSAVITGNEILDMDTYDDNIIFAGTNYSMSTGLITQVAEMDTAFNVISRFNLDSLTYLTACGLQVAFYGTSMNLTSLGNKKYLVSSGAFVINGMPCTGKSRIVASVVKNNKNVLKTEIIGMSGYDNKYYYGGFSSSKKYHHIYSTAYVVDTLNNPAVPLAENTYMMVNKLDTAGNLKWVKYFGGDMYYLPVSISASADSGAIVCGIRYDSAAPKVKGVGEAFVMKIDKSGNQVFVGIRQNGRLNTQYHKCYPNPTTDQIRFDIPLQADSEIVIYNLLGSEELRVKSYASLSYLDISALKAGTHFYKIITPSGVFSGKFVKQQ